MDFLRSEKGMSHKHLSETSDISLRHLRNLRKGDTSPSITTISTICETLGVSLSDFFKDISNGPSNERRSDSPSSLQNAS